MNAESRILEHSLPEDCRLRLAEVADRWWLQHFVLSLIRAEALSFDLRMLGYRLIRIAILLVVSVSLYWLILSMPIYWLQLALMSFLVYTVILSLVGLWVLVLYLILIPTEPLINWFLYSIVEYQGQPIGCVAMSNHLDFSVLYHLFVVPSWRQRAIGSCLVQSCTRHALKPIYLVCKPKRRAFYHRLGFRTIAWDHLDLTVRLHFRDFEIDTRYSGTLWHVMHYQPTQCS